MLLPHQFSFDEEWNLEQKVTFDGPNKLIRVVLGETDLNVRDDIYSVWKRWSLTRDNLKWLPALRAVGGDPTTGGNFLGSTYFLTNGWRITTWSGDHRLVVDGNLYTEEGDSPFTDVVGPYTATITNAVSNLIDRPDVSASIGPTDITNIQSAILSDATPFPGAYINATISSRASQVSLDFLSGVQITAQTSVTSGISNIEFETGLNEVDGFYEGMYVQVVHASGAAVRRVNSYSQTNGHIYLESALPFSPVGGNAVYVLGTHSTGNGRV